MNNPTDLQGWLDQISEEIIDQDIEIVDPHHHLWPSPDGSTENRYLLEDLWKDTESGHKVTKTVFVECGQGYFESGPNAMKPVGETKFVYGVAEEAKTDKSRAQIKGIGVHADMMFGSADSEVLVAHVEAGHGRF